MIRDERGSSLKLTRLKRLRLCELAAIDQALGEVGPNGQVHLVVKDGKLHCIRTVEKELLVETLPESGP